jgi:hypothetical protein
MTTKLVNGVPVEMSAQEVADRDAEEAAAAAAAPGLAAEAARKAAIDAAIAADARVQAWLNMTVAQQNTWWANNVTNLTQASAVMKEGFRYLLRKANP